MDFTELPFKELKTPLQDFNIFLPHCSQYLFIFDNNPSIFWARESVFVAKINLPILHFSIPSVCRLSPIAFSRWKSSLKILMGEVTIDFSNQSHPHAATKAQQAEQSTTTAPVEMTHNLYHRVLSVLPMSIRLLYLCTPRKLLLLYVRHKNQYFSFYHLSFSYKAFLL